MRIVIIFFYVKNLLMNKEYKNRFQKVSYSEPKQIITSNLSLKDLYNQSSSLLKNIRN